MTCQIQFGLQFQTHSHTNSASTVVELIPSIIIFNCLVTWTLNSEFPINFIFVLLSVHMLFVPGISPFSSIFFLFHFLYNKEKIFQKYKEFSLYLSSLCSPIFSFPEYLEYDDFLIKLITHM